MKTGRGAFWIAFAVMIGMGMLSCAVGRYPLTLPELFAILTGGGEELSRNVFFALRLPRTLFAGLTGAALAVSGLVYQELFRNPLASPDVLGVGGGASVGAVAAILAGGGLLSVRVSALLGGLLAVALSLLLSRALLGEGMTEGKTYAMILSGIVIKALADAAVMALKYFADPTRQLPTIDYWLMGSFQNIRPRELWYFLPFVLLPLFILWLLRFRIGIMALGEREARSLGIPVGVLRAVCVTAACVPVAAGAAVTGVISWVGLIVPHAVRRLSGRGILRDFGLTGLCGASFLMAADLLARTMTAAEIPISILTSAAGALFLVAIFYGKKNEGPK